MIDALPKTKGPENPVPVVVALKPLPKYWHRLLTAGLFPFFDYRQLLFFGKTRTTL
jgi:hypothetical protein